MVKVHDDETQYKVQETKRREINRPFTSIMQTCKNNNNNKQHTHLLRIQHNHPTLNSQARHIPVIYRVILVHPNISPVPWNLSAMMMMMMIMINWVYENNNSDAREEKRK